MHQTWTDACADGCLAISAQALGEKPCDFAVSEWDVTETLRLYTLLGALSQQGDTIAKSSNGLVDVFCFLESH